MVGKQKDALKKPRFYKLTAAHLPDKLFRKEVDVTEWIGDDTGGSGEGSLKSKPWLETTHDRAGFRPGSLAKIVPLDPMVEFERNIEFPLYNIQNVSPILLPFTAAAWLLLGIWWAKHILIFVVIYQGSLDAIWRIWCAPAFPGDKELGDDPARVQYSVHTRNCTKYCSTSYVWPDTLHRPALTNGDRDRPIIFCVIPHGMIPLGILGYPYFSKVWNSRMCSWTSAPITHKLPFVATALRRRGYIPAKSKPILEALTKNHRNIGIVLDGIDGMFHTAAKNNKRGGGDKNQNDVAVAAISNRKGICKIALKAGAVLVPVYGFGHSELYDVVVDPFGILEFLSIKLHVSLTPFLGRWGWFMGPPKRHVPLAMCLGEPIFPPSDDNDKNDATAAITQKQIDEHHSRLLDGFTKVFETHKKAYYGEDIGEKKKLVFV